MEYNFDIEDDSPVLGYDRSMRTFDADGHLHVETANISKANVCPYYGREIPNGVELGLEPSKIYYLYRDAAELAAAAPTYENKPLMASHVAVSAEAPQKFLIVGTVSNVRFSHPYLKASLAVWDKKAIEAIESGAQEQLSCGYRYVADMSPGVTPEGEKYDGVMRGLKCNHVALVETGRAGPDVLVSDELPQEFGTMKKVALLAALAPFLATDADKVALDAAIVALAKDGKAKDESEEATKKAAEDKAAADAELEAIEKKKAEDKAAKDAELEAAKDADLDDVEDEFPDAVAKKEAEDKKGKDKAMDAAINARVTSALAARDALHVARREVEPLLGVTAFDSAGATYGAALTKLGIATDGVPSEAFGAMLKLATKPAKGTDALATDSAGGVKTLREAFPQFNRLSR